MGQSAPHDAPVRALARCIRAIAAGGPLADVVAQIQDAERALTEGVRFHRTASLADGVGACFRHLILVAHQLPLGLPAPPWVTPAVGPARGVLPLFFGGQGRALPRAVS